MSVTRGDGEFYQGYKAGYEEAVADIRQGLLSLQYERHEPVGLKIYEVLNNTFAEMKENL